LAQWRVYATAAQWYQRLGRNVDADRYWADSAAVLTRLAGSFTDVAQLRESLCNAPLVQEILQRP
jgi:hypothetical protein